jgi:hypothetical protein
MPVLQEGRYAGEFIVSEGRPAVRPLGNAARAVEPAADLHAAARPDQGQAHLMTVAQGAVDATFAAFGIDAVYTPAGGEPVSVRVIARRRTRSSASARRASSPRPRPSSCGRARSQARGPTISSPSMARPSSSRVSRSAAVPTGSCGPWTYGRLDDAQPRSAASIGQTILNRSNTVGI